MKTCAHHTGIPYSVSNINIRRYLLLLIGVYNRKRLHVIEDVAQPHIVVVAVLFFHLAVAQFNAKLTLAVRTHFLDVQDAPHVEASRAGASVKDV